jgi:hypothetical protein
MGESVRSQVDAVNAIKELGLIGEFEYLSMMHELDPALSKKWTIEFEVDWDCAAQHDSEEILRHINQNDYFKTNSSSPIVFNKSSISVDDWDEHDYWESSEDSKEGELDTAIYGIQHYLRITTYSEPTVTVEQVEGWANEYVGSVFSDVNVTEED